MCGERRVGVLGLPRVREQPATSTCCREGLEIFDLEDEARAFNHLLPRIRIIDLADFDPVTLL